MEGGDEAGEEGTRQLWGARVSLVSHEEEDRRKGTKAEKHECKRKKKVRLGRKEERRNTLKKKKKCTRGYHSFGNRE